MKLTLAKITLIAARLVTTVLVTAILSSCDDASDKPLSQLIIGKWEAGGPGYFQFFEDGTFIMKNETTDTKTVGSWKSEGRNEVVARFKTFGTHEKVLRFPALSRSQNEIYVKGDREGDNFTLTRIR